ncbi:type II toxin-antitoxin system HigB family toxin [Nitrosomonas communis]|uniref:type II toxin-antitoxin system HigB family toxin n=1 Tax=Nitrosomonas communis TaxID=44574 RepID=UPI0021087CE4|nr:type II toxin-antitoxin system HigB family toxin [Nitrosomonas communis]
MSFFLTSSRILAGAHAEAKADFKDASTLKDSRVIFNIASNKYRLVVWINYVYSVVYIRFISTHAQCDQIDAQTI